MKKSTLSGLFALVRAGLTRLPGAVRVLALLMALSYLSAVAASALGKDAKGVRGALSPRALLLPLLRKAMMLVIVLLSALMDAQMNLSVCAAAVTAFYLLTEALSILDSALALGVPVPQKLRDVLNAAKKTRPGDS